MKTIGVQRHLYRRKNVMKSRDAVTMGYSACALCVLCIMR